MTFGDLKGLTRTDLNDAGITFYSAEDLDDSAQDGYDDIVFQTQCVVKRAAGLPWLPKVGYLDFVGRYNISDYMGTTAIFNNESNQWLRDDVSIRDFDKLRVDWETWSGQPQMWAPVNNKFVAVAPRKVESGGTFDLIYWTQAPTITSDTIVPKIANDMQILLEYYMTADMLEQCQEYVKANKWWTDYFVGIATYAQRVKNLAKSDLVLTL